MATALALDAMDQAVDRPSRPIEALGSIKRPNCFTVMPDSPRTLLCIHRCGAKPMLIDSKVWLDHFEYHSTHRAALPRRTSLAADQRQRIASSIATFQLGEQSQGRCLQRAARRYELARDAAPLARIIELLIAEEQHHAALLGSFMDQQGIPRKVSHWTDRVFRWVRRLGGFELHICVLITAELIGKVYYRALEAATGCAQLRALCRLLVADELAHVGFESALLLAMRARQGPLVRSAKAAAHHALLAGASWVVWLTHGRVLRAAGYRRGSFLRACEAQYCFYLAPAQAAAPLRRASWQRCSQANAALRAATIPRSGACKSRVTGKRSRIQS
jgi:hypothetical protein